MLTILLLGAFVVTTPELPPSEYRDTEMSTNIPISVSNDAITRLAFDISLDASPSNAVEVSVGTDVDGDGRLSLDESVRTFGYDCGEWFVRDMTRDTLEVTAADTGRITREFILHQNKIDPLWNLVKVTRRGAPVTAELVNVTGSHPGLLLRLR